MKKPRWDTSLSAAANSRAVLPGLAHEYFEEGRKVMAGTPAPACLHRFRLDTKTYRYTMELFQACYGPGLRQRIAVLRQIQGYLGLINDCATTADLVASRLPAGDSNRARIETLLATRAKRKLVELRRFWRQVVDAPRQERRWCNYLARPRQ